MIKLLNSITCRWGIILLMLLSGHALKADAKEPGDTHKSKQKRLNAAKKHVDQFLTMDNKKISTLLGCNPSDIGQAIQLDEGVSLKLETPRVGKLFTFSRYRHPLFDSRGQSAFPKSGNNDEIIWSGWQPKSEREYWTIIKPNLERFIGMSSEEIVSLLGRERCSLKLEFMDYRIGDHRLRFYFTDGAVEKFTFRANQYLGTT